MSFHDVIIIGAGPAGLQAARTLQAAGADYLLLDKKAHIGLPLCCGEGIRREGFLHLFGHDRFPFVVNRPELLEVSCGKHSKLLQVPYLMLDRPGFENWLAQPVLEHTRLQSACEQITVDRETVHLKTGSGTHACHLLILACGCDYRLQRNLGLIKRAPLRVPCYGGLFRIAAPQPDRLRFFFNDRAGTGLWVFPKQQDQANVGLALFPGQKMGDIRSHFRHAVERAGLDLQGEPSYAGVFPTEAPLPCSHGNRILLCGDAAAHIYAGAGEGIWFALRGGVLAAETALAALAASRFDASFLKRYQTTWNREFGHHIRAGMVFARLFAAGFHTRHLGSMIRYSREQELHALFVQGRVPWRARAASALLRFKPGGNVLFSRFFTL